MVISIPVKEALIPKLFWWIILIVLQSSFDPKKKKKKQKIKVAIHNLCVHVMGIELWIWANEWSGPVGLPNPKKEEANI